jgi:hypothetical protein
MSSVRHALRRENDPTRWAGQLAWGWRVSAEGTVVRDEAEEQVVAVARHMRATGATLRQIVEFLRKQGIVGRRGTPIGTTRVFEMIHGGRKKQRNGVDGSHVAKAVK